jgi:hypothetical protein
VFTVADFGFTDVHDSDAFIAVTIDSLPVAGVLLLNNVAVNATDSISTTDIANGDLIFRPVAQANGAGYAGFTFRVQDDDGTADGGSDIDVTSRTMTIDVTSVNDAPIGADNTVTTLEDTDYVFTVADFGFTDVNDGNAFMAVTIDTLPALGTLLLNNVAVSATDSISTTDIASGDLIYRPVAQANGAGYAGFNFRVQDDDGAAGGGSDIDAVARTMTIDVTSVNDAPIGADNTVTTLEDTDHVFAVADFGFTDVNDGDIFQSVTVDTLPVLGTLLLNSIAISAGDSISTTDIANGELVYRPVAQANGAAYASFTFRVQDDDGTANGGGDIDLIPRTMTIDVTAVNDDPFNGGSIPVSQQIVEDITGVVDLSEINIQDIDANHTGDTLTLSINSSNGGTLQIAAAAGLAVTGSGSNAVSVTGSLTAINTWLNAGNALSYVPVSQVNGPGVDGLTVRINDNGNTGIGGGVAIDLGTIRIDVISVNDEPAGTDNTLTTNEDTALVINAADFGFTDVNDDVYDSNALSGVRLSRFPDEGGLTLSGSSVAVGDTISVADINAGLLVYTPGLDGRGLAYASLDFQVQDTGGTNNGGIDLDASPNTITFDVVSINDAPEGQNLTVATAEDTDYTIQVADLGYSDRSDGDQLLSIEIAGVPVNGTLTLNGVAVSTGQQISALQIAAGELVFSPDPEAYGVAYGQFSFIVRDDGGLPGVDTAIATNTLTIDVTGVNDAPAGADRTVVTDEDVPYVFSAVDFGFVDSRDLTDSLSGVLISTLPDKGVLTAGGNAVAVGDVIDIAAINAGEFSYLAESHENGTGYSSFNFQVQDGNTQPGNNTDLVARQLTINVTPVSDAPLGPGSLVSTLEDNDYTLQISDFTFSDVNDNDDFVAVIVDQLPSSGTLLLQSAATDDSIITEPVETEVTVGQLISEADIAAGMLIYRPLADVHGSDQFEFRLLDSGVDSNTGSTFIDNISIDRGQLDIDVIGVNDAPSGTNNTVTTNEDTPHTFVREDFGFSDPLDSIQQTDNNHPFTAITIFSLPEVGALLVDGVEVVVGQVVSTADIDAGLLVYVPPENETGTNYNGFGFQVHDGAGTENGGIDIDPTPNFISFDLPGVNDPPFLVSEVTTVAEGNEIVITQDLLFGADADDPDPLDLTLTITRLPDHGELYLGGVPVNTGDSFTLQAIIDELLSYLHDESETSADAFGVALTDGGEDGAEPAVGDFNFIVTEVIDPAPVLDNDLLELSFGEAFNSLDGDLLASGFSALNKDSLIDDSRYSVTLEVPPVHGVVVLNGDGTFEYTHDGSRILQDEFSYRVTNEDGIFTIATVSISIEPALEAAFTTPPPTPAPPVVSTEPEPDPEPEELQSSASTDEEEAEAEKGQFEQAEDIFAGPRALSSEQVGRESVLEVLRSVQTDSSEEVRARTGELESHDMHQHNKVTLATLQTEALNTVSSTTVELLLEVKIPTAREVIGNKNFLDGLSQLDEDLKDAETNSTARYRLAEDTVLGVSLSMTVGALAWALRGGAIFTSLMTVAPLWASIDLGKIVTPIVHRRETDPEVDPSGEQSVEEIFDKE